MKLRNIFSLISCLLLVLSLPALAQTNENSKDFKDAVEQSEKAAKVFNEIMGTPDKAVPQNLIDKAECVAVFPDVIKAGFIVGGRGGRGVASCRVNGNWSAPIFMDIGGASFGAQIGAESTDFVLLFMNKNGLDSLVKNNIELGGELSVSAGPVGRTAAASTDAALNAQILSYSRSKGLFAGAVLKGAGITRDDSAMDAVYGKNTASRTVLQDSKFTVPSAVRAFPNTLAKYSTRK